MKLLPLTLALSLVVLPFTLSAQLEVGDLSKDTTFALFDGNELQPASLASFEGKLVIAYYYTPW